MIILHFHILLLIETISGEVCVFIKQAHSIFDWKNVIACTSWVYVSSIFVEKPKAFWTEGIDLMIQPERSVNDHPQLCKIYGTAVADEVA